MAPNSAQAQLIKTINEQNTECVIKNGKELNGDCFIQIFEELDYPTLLDMTKVSKDFAYYARMAFRRAFIDYEIEISYDEPTDHAEYSKTVSNVMDELDKYTDAAPEYPYTINADRIAIHDFNLILQTLRNFGPFIRKLKIELSDTDSDRSRIIYKFIEKYCMDSLIELDMLNVEILKYMKKPSSTVRHIHYRNVELPMQPNQHRLNETFPALRALTLLLQTDYVDPIDCYFPHLEHISIKRLFNMDFIGKFLRSHSHIHSADVCVDYPRNLFHELPSLLPNVNHLTVAYVPFVSSVVDPEICFENVTKLTAMKGFNPTVKIFFPKLQELHMTYWFYVEQWSVFFKKHPHLRRFHLTFSNLNDEEINGILEHLPNLEEVTITKMDNSMESEKKSIRMETFIAFIKNNNKLRLLRLNGYTEDDRKIFQTKGFDDMRIFQKDLESEWSFVYRDNGIVLQKQQKMDI